MPADDTSCGGARRPRASVSMGVVLRPAGAPPSVDRRERLARARVYLVIEPGSATDVLEPALIGGVDIVQLRDKEASDDEIVRAGERFRSVCDRHGALLVVNDRPDLALRCAADGVHLGQDDGDLDEARELVGPDVLIGVSTHTPEQVDAAARSTADYLGVGPVHETATKPGRPAVGLALVRHAAAGGPKPFFAIGGIDATNAPDVVRAGAERVAVVRAIRDAEDPGAAARALRAVLGRAEAVAAL